MPGDSKIQWTDSIWNPVTGCTKVSAGCLNCYAEMMTRRFQWDGPFVPWTVRAQRDSGEPPVYIHEDRLSLPLHWRRPRKVFVNSMSDLFHEAVPWEFIDRVFEVMSQATQHTFQVLTKRPDRMADFAGRQLATKHFWPANVWAGTSVEHPKYLYRLDDLAHVPAPIRFVSCEPLLGPLDLRPWLVNKCQEHGLEYLVEDSDYAGTQTCGECGEEPLPVLSWVIIGGESGARPRPMHPTWPRRIRDDCQERGVPVFFKQWGEWVPLHPDHLNAIEQHRLIQEVQHWDPGLEGRQGNRVTMARVGRKVAGALLDGREWKEFPNV